ncbi:HU family DNA-binding protein [Klenkia sp. PcliD-1-E]|uniref:HU family DNA-binding protein n=1 Tax=Klenkia sp. PcliD-1-E TaxID=2954492 RepID=UPI0020983E28|nr:HU family DNA-binding protein [Klenkia sp. PcliD-1-E]MCO7218575.1 HU family DNA-binding protein [Klenkia sp. PcliD-1-E]
MFCKALTGHAAERISPPIAESRWPQFGWTLSVLAGASSASGGRGKSALNKTDLVSKLTERLGGDRATAVAAVNGVLEEIGNSVARGERVALTGFGTFDRRERAARTARNPRTGESVDVRATTVPVFRAGTAFRALLTEADNASSSLRSTSVDEDEQQAAGTETVPASIEPDKADPGADAKNAVQKARGKTGEKKKSKNADGAQADGKGSKKSGKKAKNSK